MKSKDKINLCGKLIGKGEPCFIIAEAGINHNGEINTAKKMIDAAKECGASAVKFQTFTAKELVADEKLTYAYQSQGREVAESMAKIFERCEFSKEQWQEIADYCIQKNIIFFSTPQNVSNLNLLLEIGVPAIKVGSDDLVNLPLLDEYSKKGLPMIISAGMAYLKEVEDAVKTIKKNNQELIILHCVSSYPAESQDLNLRKILTLKKAFSDCVIGFSDHSEGATAAVVSVALGALVFEKHFTLNKNMPGPDQRFSADPDELKEIIKAIRTTEKALGSPVVQPTEREMEMRTLCHRSIVADRNIKKGEELTKGNTAAKRPGTGILAKFENQVLGKRAKQDIKEGELITLEKLT